MKNLASSMVVLACVSGIVSLPTVYNVGDYAMSTQFSPLGQFKLSPELAALFQLYAPSAQSAYSNPPATYASATAPSAGVNVGGGTGARPGSITTTIPANGGGGVVNVPAGSSVTVTGGNGSVSGAGSANQGNGGSVVVTAGSGNGDNSTANNGSDASTSDSS